MTRYEEAVDLPAKALLVERNAERWSDWDRCVFDGGPVVGMCPDPCWVIAGLLEHYGREFPFRPKPKGFRFKAFRECFRNAANLACASELAVDGITNDPIFAEVGRLTYVEGLACGGFGFMHHAWAIDGDGCVVETTWREPGTRYFGIPFDTRYVLGVVRRRHLYAPLLAYPSPLLEGEDLPEQAIHPNMKGTP